MMLPIVVKVRVVVKVKIVPALQRMLPIIYLHHLQVVRVVVREKVKEQEIDINDDIKRNLYHPKIVVIVVIVRIEIDNYKKLNDRLGHASGDAALQFLTRRVTQALRPGDTLARYGGEEFVVLLPGTPLDEAQRVLTRVQRTLSAELFMSDEQGQVFVTFSAGVSLYRSGERLEQSLERADEALYEAKHSGKNRTCAA